MFGTNDVSRPSFKPFASCRETRNPNLRSVWLLKNEIVTYVAVLHLILHGDLCGESVVGVPFLVEAEAQLVQLVLGLQVASRLPCIRVVGAGSGELLQSRQGLFKDGEAEKTRHDKAKGKREEETSSFLML